MNRPTTRSKNKKPKPSDDVDKISDTLRKIHASGEITQDDINQLYNIGKPVCQGCRVNAKDNPNCFCGLIPSPNGSRKSGIWQKMSDVIQSLGPDPFKELRASLDSPAGLTNLGATCYANSILQCLYMNATFRRGFLSIEVDVLRKQPVLDQLARLFAQLHASKRAFVDSAPFIKTLELDNGVQQDSHEFLTLLLSLLERCLSNSRSVVARTIVQDLFRGSVSHVTTCSRCGKDSEASSKIEDFYELELNVLGLKSLDESLNDYLRVEQLNGENQYFCESCGARVDASRSIKLRTLPRVLNIQLKRYVFLPKTTTKKKITSAFSFPRELDMRKRLCDPAQADLIYDLSAILIHKGTAVNSGHYIAHIRDEKAGQWWEFDDEHVSNLGDHPFGEDSSGYKSKPSQKEPLRHSSPVSAAGDATDDVLPHLAENGDSEHSEIFSSADAYMLMYNLRQTNTHLQKTFTVLDANNIETEHTNSTSNDITSLPFYLRDEVDELNASYVEACHQYKLQKETTLHLMEERRQEVRLILSEAPVQSFEEPFYWISANWLRLWVDNIMPPVLDNTLIQCSHGKVHMAEVGSMKRLSACAWVKLFSKYGGGPALANDDYCVDCLKEAANRLVCADSYRDRRKTMKELADYALSGNCSDGTYYVSKAWLQQWVKRKITDAPSEADAGPTASIRCPHGQLMPEQAAGARRLLVPENLWLFFYEDALTVNPDDPLGCPSFHISSEQCCQCSEKISEVACLEDSLRAVKNKQRENHEKLAAGKSFPILPYHKYYLLPSVWLTTWRNYVNASGKNTLSCNEPESLDSVIDKLTCAKHLRLLERPLDLVHKRGAIFQKVSLTDGLTIITSSDWKCFCEEWGCSENKGISAIIEHDNDAQDKGMCGKESLIGNEQLGSIDGSNNRLDERRLVIRTSPEVCEECVGERASSELMQRLNYCNEDIYVTFVHGKEVPKSILEAPEAAFDPGRRISKRSRRTNYGSAVNLKVSGSTSIYQLKMMIWESLGVVKENQIIHKGHTKIEGESSTLADLNIFPGDTLWVRDSKIHEHRDIADEISIQKMDVEHAEEGFRGTLLTTDFPS
ncbi:ubiquitin carboxyl-terminal hydrolase 26 isoform X2 [Rhodamnia argentea]|uniref:Ubiquitin carboxyl-terminal hydrolase 26 n=1 Tax=Rhodamnia argentea TaxID=178133 RepID=A0A8B8QUQ8_9MYRT|nr:ubiquitin carboxyl-terminal hydrolase 26 isoform X2 [Rhodamnia argentea]